MYRLPVKAGGFLVTAKELTVLLMQEIGKFPCKI